VTGEPIRRVIRREVVRTERVRREISVRLNSTQAIRLGAKLVVRGLVATVRRRPVQLTLRSDPARTSATLASTDDLAVGLADPISGDEADAAPE
jgi:hypothetical protein